MISAPKEYRTRLIDNLAARKLLERGVFYYQTVGLLTAKACGLDYS